MRIFDHCRPKFDVCLSIDARLIYVKPSSSDACEFPKGLLQRFVNEIKVYPENTVSGFVFFFSNEDGLFKVRRNYKDCFC